MVSEIHAAKMTCGDWAVRWEGFAADMMAETETLRVSWGKSDAK